MSDALGVDKQSCDPIPLALERALFVRFWIWLGIVGSLIFAGVTAISILVAQNLSAVSESAALKAIDRLTGKINDLEARAIDVTAQSRLSQKESYLAAATAKSSAKEAEEQARIAEAELQKVKGQLAAQGAILSAANNIQAITETLATKPGFAELVAANLLGQLKQTQLSKTETKDARLGSGNSLEC